MSESETRLAALFALADAAITATCERNGVLPVQIPAGGHVIMRDGSSGRPEMTFPLKYHFDHRVEFEFYCQDHSDRQAVTDALKAQLGAAIGAHRDLGGLCDWVEIAPVESDDQRVEGAEAIRVDLVEIVMSYATNNPLT